MYSKVSLGYNKVFGPEYPRSQSLRNKLCALDARGGTSRAGEGVES